MALLVAGCSMLTKVGNERCFLLMLDEELWGPLVLELWCDDDPWLQSGSCVGLCWELSLHASLLQPEPWEGVSWSWHVEGPKLWLYCDIGGTGGKGQAVPHGGFGRLTSPDLDGGRGRLDETDGVVGLGSLILRCLRCPPHYSFSKDCSHVPCRLGGEGLQFG